MLKNLIKYLTPKKINPMSKQHENPENKENQKDIKKIVNALKQSNENLKTIKKQFSFDDEHFVSATIKANEELLKTL